MGKRVRREGGEERGRCFKGNTGETSDRQAKAERIKAFLSA